MGLSAQLGVSASVSNCRSAVYHSLFWRLISNGGIEATSNDGAPSVIWSPDFSISSSIIVFKYLLESLASHVVVAAVSDRYPDFVPEKRKI